MSDSLHTLPRLYTSATMSVGQSVVLPENQAHYLKNVLRCDEQSAVRLFNAQSGEWVGTLGFQGKKTVVVTLTTQVQGPFVMDREVHLFYSPIKKDRHDLLIEKAVELGVTHVHPVLFQRSIVREVKVERVEAQMIEATEQCERLDIPVLYPVVDFKKAFATWDTTHPVFAAIERRNAVPLSAQNIPQICGYVVGPEGGIAADEAELLSKKSFVVPVSLGPRILRAETAVFYGLSYLCQ